MPDLDSLKALATLGVGGILAGIIFFAYRRDFLREREARTTRETVLIQLVQDNTRACESMANAAGKVEHAVNNLRDSMQWAGWKNRESK